MRYAENYYLCELLHVSGAQISLGFKIKDRIYRISPPSAEPNALSPQ